MTTDQFVLLQNLLWLVFGLTVAITFGASLIRGGQDRSTRRIMTGVILVSLGGAFHRTYWALWRWARNRWGADDPVAVWFVDSADYVAICVAAICIGYALHLQPLAETMLGAWWPIVPAGLAVLLWAISFVLV